MENLTLKSLVLCISLFPLSAALGQAGPASLPIDIPGRYDGDGGRCHTLYIEISETIYRRQLHPSYLAQILRVDRERYAALKDQLKARVEFSGFTRSGEEYIAKDAKTIDKDGRVVVDEVELRIRLISEDTIGLSGNWWPKDQPRPKDAPEELVLKKCVGYK
ncbi:MAG: hypothetical protein RIM84_09355 [Alphaproteobacteria bacterium]